jgi:dihydrofolate synthase/folylpolyglutamate synthase
VDYRSAIDYLLSFTDLERGVQRSANPTMSLASVRSLLSRLNQPQLGRGTVHVTGSKGKGTTATMVESILRHAGLSTALYTSPHLHDYTERIALGGRPVSRAEFAAALDAIRPAIEDERAANGDVSTFGILTALFFWLVRAQVPRVQWQVVEVGLGGAFDATNVFEETDVVVITPISLEHTAILGPTTLHIAHDKSALVKPGSTCILAPQRDPAVTALVRERCGEVGARFVDVASRYRTEVTERHSFGQAFRVEGPGGVFHLRTSLLGDHQVDNAATAVAVADALRERGVPITALAVSNGIARARIRGRMEVMGQRPVIVADGAHNSDSAAALAAALRQSFQWDQAVLVLGVLRDKDPATILEPLLTLDATLIATRIAAPRAADPALIAAAAATLGTTAEVIEPAGAAITTAIERAGPGGLVAITGSLYLVAEAREQLLGEAAMPA